MKNIHVLPTEKPSRLFKHNNAFFIEKEFYESTPRVISQNIYITSGAEDINENDYIISKDGRLVQVSYLLSKDLEDASKVILTTDQDLIKDGVQAIDDEFLEWFVKNPSYEEVEFVSAKTIPALQLTGNGHCWWKIIIPKEEPKQETINPADFMQLGEKAFEEEIEQAKEMEKQKDAKYNEMLETLEIVAKKLNRNGFPSLQNQIEKVIKDVKPI
jgi:hypothetical protein